MEQWEIQWAHFFHRMEAALSERYPYQAMHLIRNNDAKAFCRMNWSPTTFLLKLDNFSSTDHTFLQFAKGNFKPSNTTLRIYLSDCKWKHYLHSIFDRTFLGKTGLEFFLEDGSADNSQFLEAINDSIHATMMNQRDSKLEYLGISSPANRDMNIFADRLHIPPCRKFAWIGESLPEKLIHVL